MGAGRQFVASGPGVSHGIVLQSGFEGLLAGSSTFVVVELQDVIISLTETCFCGQQN